VSRADDVEFRNSIVLWLTPVFCVRWHCRSKCHVALHSHGCKRHQVTH